ncbi:MAG: hypothetical protein ACRDUA_18105, partial [Micromonosporaceae bacterium]
ASPGPRQSVPAGAVCRSGSTRQRQQVTGIVYNRSATGALLSADPPYQPGDELVVGGVVTAVGVGQEKVT